MATDIHGRLNANVEVLFELCGVQIKPAYTDHLLIKEKTRRDTMLNLESQLVQLANFNLDAVSVGCTDYTFPKDNTGSTAHWRYYLGNVPKVPENVVAHKVLQHIVACQEAKVMKTLPIDLIDMIVSEADRIKISKQKNGNLSNLMKTNEEFHGVRDGVSKYFSNEMNQDRDEDAELDSKPKIPRHYFNNGNLMKQERNYTSGFN
jgi:hypothetical protein